MAFYFNSPFFRIPAPYGGFFSSPLDDLLFDAPFGSSPFPTVGTGFFDPFRSFPRLQVVYRDADGDTPMDAAADQGEQQAATKQEEAAPTEQVAAASPTPATEDKPAEPTAEAKPDTVTAEAAAPAEAAPAPQASTSASTEVATKPAYKPFSLSIAPTDEHYTLTYALPVTAPKESLEISLSPDGTSLSFKFEDKKEEEGRKSYRRVERVWGLPRDADTDKIEAAMKENGVVEVRVGRKEVKEEVPKRKLISVL